MKALVKNKTSVGVDVTDKPKVMKPDDVLIRVALAGLCRTDVYVAEGRIKSKDPLVLGHEFSGIVEAVGSDVAHLKTGERVAVMPLFPVNDAKMPNGLPIYAGATMMGVDHDGAFGEYALVPSYAVYRLPAQVTLMQGAYLEPVAASMAVLNAAIASAQKGLIFGDNRISRLTERVLLAKGFTDVTVCSHADDLPDNAYDFVIETLATTDVMNKIIRAVKPGGRIVLKSRQHVPVAFNINTLVLKDIKLDAVSYGDFQEGIDLIADGRLRVDDLFGDVFQLEQFADVFAQSRLAETRKLFFTAYDQDVWGR